jgi:hypothetical protein
LADWGEIFSVFLVVSSEARFLPARVSQANAEIAKRRATILAVIASIEVVDVEAAVLDRAAQPMPTELSTLGAIHLATALLWKEMKRVDLVMATHDEALALGAQAHGLPVVGVTQRRAEIGRGIKIW